MMERITCTCMHSTPFAHMHAENCPRHVPQFVGRSERVEDVDARLAEDYLLYGVSYHTVDDQGTKVRIDPTKLIIHLRGVTSEMVEQAKAEQCKHDWIVVEALNRECCTQCEATRSAV